MIWFFLIVVFWLLVGVFNVAVVIYWQWKEGQDLSLGQLREMLGMIPLGLLLWTFILYDWAQEKIEKISINKNAVILPGSKSAKTYKALINDKWDPN